MFFKNEFKKAFDLYLYPYTYDITDWYGDTWKLKIYNAHHNVIFEKVLNSKEFCHMTLFEWLETRNIDGKYDDPDSY